MLVGGLALGLTSAAIAGMPAQALDSNPPSGPGNVEVFPVRDMVAIEGYGDQAGKQATIKVLRDGQVVGSAVGTVDASGFLEVNHPGGVCWGAGTALQVTPDITAGDEIRVDFSDGHWDGSQVVDVAATGVTVDEATRSLTIEGRYGPGVDMPGTDLVADPGKFGIEIVNPDMRDGTSAIGERAIGWPTDDAPTGHTVTGSVTGTDADGGTFSVTYGFQSLEDLDLAYAGSITALGWLAEPDPALGVEQQLGLTLNEFYEFGGPGMGGCPAGPSQIRTDGPTTYSAKGAGAGSIQVDWNAAVPTAGAPAVTGYVVRAVAGEDEVGKRLGADARTATLTGLVPDGIYSVEIYAKSDAGEGTPSVISRVRAAAHVVPTATATTARPVNADGTYDPLVVEDGVDYGVFLDPAADVIGAEVHYTTDGTTPKVTSRTLPLGTSIKIDRDTTVRWVVVDSGNIVGPVGERFFDITEADGVTQPAPGTPTVTVPAVSGALDVSFPRLSDPAVTTYRIQAYDATGTTRVGQPVDVAQTASTDPVLHQVTGLRNGTEYTFTVAAKYGTVWSVESGTSDPVAPQAPASADAGPDQTVLRNRTVTLDGSGSVRATGYLWTQLGTDPAVAGADPAVTLSDPTAAKPTFLFPRKTSPTSDDGTLAFQLTASYADGTTRTDTVAVTERRDTVGVDEARWRAGKPLRLDGTGSQNGAVLTFHDASANGALIGRATVTNGVWTAPSVTVSLSTGAIYIWSDHGYMGTVQTTR